MPAPKKKETYSQAMERLEKIVSQIDNNELEIDELAVKIKEANEIIAFCSDKLTKADCEVQKPIDTARFAYMSDLYLNNKETLSVGFVLAEDDKALVLASIGQAGKLNNLEWLFVSLIFDVLILYNFFGR